jgi:hypothetical protein
MCEHDRARPGVLGGAEGRGQAAAGSALQALPEAAAGGAAGSAARRL